MHFGSHQSSPIAKKPPNMGGLFLHYKPAIGNCALGNWGNCAWAAAAMLDQSDAAV